MRTPPKMAQPNKLFFGEAMNLSLWMKEFFQETPTFLQEQGLHPQDRFFATLAGFRDFLSGYFVQQYFCNSRSLTKIIHVAIHKPLTREILLIFFFVLCFLLKVLQQFNKNFPQSLILTSQSSLPIKLQWDWNLLKIIIEMGSSCIWVGSAWSLYKSDKEKLPGLEVYIISA